MMRRPGALFPRDFLLLWHGQLVSQLGNQAFLIATTYHVLEVTGSAGLVAAAMMAATIPLVILGPIAGTVADRHSRRGIVIATDAARAVATGGLGMALLRQEGTPDHLALIVTVAAFNGVMGALFAPAFQALVPELVPAGRLAAANSFNQISNQTSTLLGQALGGIFYAAWGPATLLLVDAVSFAYAGVAAWCLPRDRSPAPASAGVRLAFRQFAADTAAGMAYVWRRPGMTAVLGVFAGVNCLFMPVFVLLPFYVREVLGAGPGWYGFLLSGLGAGALAGSVSAGVLLANVRAHAALVRGSLGGVAAAVVLLGATDATWLAVAALATLGALSSIINVTVFTAFQSAVPADVRGRVMALLIASSTAAVPIGMGIGGVLGDHWRGSLPSVFVGSGLAILALSAVSWIVRGFDGVFQAHSPGPSARV